VLLRRAAVLWVVVAGVLFVAPVRAGAHSAAVLTIHADGLGAVWVTAEWQDGHPITEPVAAAVTATSGAGQRVGPAALRRSAERPDALTLADRLGPGDWTVVAEMAAPTLGRCEATLRVAPAAAASETTHRCPVPVAAAPARPRSNSTRPAVLVVAFVAPLVAVLIGLFAFRHRLGLVAPPARSRSRK